MLKASQAVDLPVRKSASEGASLTRIDSPLEMEGWGEVINGPLSPKALSVIEEFFGVKPKVTSWLIIQGSQIPNTYEFPIPGMSNGAELTFRIWQYGVGSKGQAEIDLCAKSGKPASALYCDSQQIGWIGIGHSQLLVATKHSILYRATRQRCMKQDRLGRFWNFSKVHSFWIEMRSLRDTGNGFAHYVPTNLR